MARQGHDLRSEVLTLADERGWERETLTTRHGSTSDQLSKNGVVLTLFWSRSARLDHHWDTGLIEDAEGARQVWKITTPGGLLDILRS